ncbi:hypothetical protein [Agrobacterium tumefaciens]|uniref:hypothetical protein n=1 Tax=Agrobacterium tumefaciens TaxID=358 RepID=UPI003BA2BBAF
MTTPEPQTRVPEVAVADPEVNKTCVRDLAKHLVVTSVRHIDELDVKDGLRRAVAAQHAAIEEFIEAKLGEGYSLEEINQSSAIQLQVMPSITDRNGRVKVEWPYKIIGRDD